MKKKICVSVLITILLLSMAVHDREASSAAGKTAAAAETKVSESSVSETAGSTADTAAESSGVDSAEEGTAAAETPESEAAESETQETETQETETQETETSAATDPEQTALKGLETKIETDSLEISLACSTPSEGTIVGEAFTKAIDAVSEWTDGKVVIHFYSDGEVGSDAEIIEGLQMGILDAVFSTPTSETVMMPDLAVLDIGGLYTDLDTANKVVDQFRDNFDSIYSDAGFHLASIYVPAFRVLSSNQPIRSAADLKDLKIRTQENTSHMTFWQTLGCTPIPLDYSDLSMALQQGIVDAEENPVGSIVGSGLDQLQSYIIKTDHIPFVSTLVANQKWYDGLSDEQKLVFDQFAEYTERYIMAGVSAEEEEMYAACEAEGIEVTEVPEDIKALYPAAAQKVIDELKKTDGVDSKFVDQYVEAAGFSGK